MLVSKRFTTAITRSTKDRLDAAMQNISPITRRERHRGAVIAIQAALADLHQGYLTQAEVDGYFGSTTAAAVEAFQRDYGMIVDGVVGRQTLTELDQIFAGENFREPQGMSIHVGVNRVDPGHYGAEYPLTACINDARDFRDLASALGYNPIVLTNTEATTANFTAAIRQAATNLFAGDALFVTFSGHGSQIENTSSDAEVDLMDETFCFYDRMLIDDELYALLTEIRAGVQVTMIYDSCHSATATRMILADDAVEFAKAETKMLMARSLESPDPDLPAVGAEGEQAPSRFLPIARDKLSNALDGDRPEQPAPRSLPDEQLDEIADLVVAVRDLRGDFGALAKERLIPEAMHIYRSNQALYDAVKTVIGEREEEMLNCTVVAFSACQDNQTTLDGAVNGFFTGNVLSAWDRGGFPGSAQQFYDRLVAVSRPTITPALNTYGGPRAAARVHERPFAF